MAPPPACAAPAAGAARSAAAHVCGPRPLSLLAPAVFLPQTLPQQPGPSCRPAQSPPPSGRCRGVSCPCDLCSFPFSEPRGAALASSRPAGCVTTFLCGKVLLLHWKVRASGAGAASVICFCLPPFVSSVKDRVEQVPQIAVERGKGPTFPPHHTREGVRSSLHARTALPKVSKMRQATARTACRFWCWRPLFLQVIPCDHVMSTQVFAKNSYWNVFTRPQVCVDVQPWTRPQSGLCRMECT